MTRRSSTRCRHQANGYVVRAIGDAELVVMLTTTEIDEREAPRRGIGHEVEQQDEPR